MQKRLISLFSLYVFVFFFTYPVFIYFFIPYSIKNYGNVAYIWLLAMLPIFMILILLLPKKISQIKYRGILKKSFLAKLAFIALQLFGGFFNLFVSVRVLGQVFFYDYNILIFIVLSVLVAVLLSTNRLDVIVNSASFLYVMAFVLLLFSSATSNTIKDYTLLLPFSLNFKWAPLVCFGYLFIDALGCFLLIEDTNRPIKRCHLMLLVSLMISYYSFKVFETICLSGVNYLVNNEFIGIFSFLIQDAQTYIGDYGFICIYVLTLMSIYRLGFSLKACKDLLGIKENKLVNLIIFLFSLTITYTFVNYISLYEALEKSLLFIVLGGFFIYILFVINRSEQYEIHY